MVRNKIQDPKTQKTVLPSPETREGTKHHTVLHIEEGVWTLVGKEGPGKQGKSPFI